MTSSKMSNFGPFVIVGISLMFAAYFCFSAVQGDLGVLRRVEYQAEERALQAELDRLTVEIAKMQNKTQRLSDHSLDLELLDQQVRDVLGRVRPDEIVIQ